MKRGLTNYGKLIIYRPVLDECYSCGNTLLPGNDVYLDDCGEYLCFQCGEEEVEEEEG